MFNYSLQEDNWKLKEKGLNHLLPQKNTCHKIFTIVVFLLPPPEWGNLQVSWLDPEMAVWSVVESTCCSCFISMFTGAWKYTNLNFKGRYFGYFGCYWFYAWQEAWFIQYIEKIIWRFTHISVRGEPKCVITIINVRLLPWRNIECHCSHCNTMKTLLQLWTKIQYMNEYDAFIALIW